MAPDVVPGPLGRCRRESPSRPPPSDVRERHRQVRAPVAPWPLYCSNTIASRRVPALVEPVEALAEPHDVLAGGERAARTVPGATRSGSASQRRGAGHEAARPVRRSRRAAGRRPAPPPGRRTSGCGGCGCRRWRRTGTGPGGRRAAAGCRPAQPARSRPPLPRPRRGEVPLCPRPSARSRRPRGAGSKRAVASSTRSARRSTVAAAATPRFTGSPASGTHRHALVDGRLGTRGRSRRAGGGSQRHPPGQLGGEGQVHARATTAAGWRPDPSGRATPGADCGCQQLVGDLFRAGRRSAAAWPAIQASCAAGVAGAAGRRYVPAEQAGKEQPLARRRRTCRPR